MQTKQTKRAFIRLAAYHLVKYKSLSTEKESAVPTLAAIKDIGAGGVCLRTEEYLPVSSVIELRIIFPSHSTPIFTLARVAWIRQVGKQRYYEVGAQFIEIEETTRRAINEKIRLVYQNLGGSINLSTFLFSRKGGGIMNMLAKILIVLAAIFLLIALSVKFSFMGKALPFPLPLNWAKLGDTALLFSIAISVLNRK